MNYVKCSIDRKRQIEKPKNSEIGAIVNRMKQVNITVQELSELLASGGSFRPARCNGANDESWESQCLFCLDFDKGTPLQIMLNKCKQLGLSPCFGYYTFSHTEQEHRFRLVFRVRNEIIDGDIRDKVISILYNLFHEQVDSSCLNRARIFFGGKDLFFTDFEAVVDENELITKYSNYIDKYYTVCSNNMSKNNPKTKKTNNEHKESTTMTGLEFRNGI